MTINTQTFEGLSGGMDLSIPAHDLPANKARYLQDVLLDVPGLIRRRGILKILTGFSASIGYKATGLVATTDPAGVTKLGILAGDGTNAKITYLPDPFTSAGTTANLFIDHAKATALTFPTSASGRMIVDSHAALGGGAFIGIASGYQPGASQGVLYYWRGATKADHTTGSTVTATRSSKTVTATVDLTSNVEIGMFMFDNASPNNLIGVVSAISFSAGTTTITLEDKALIGISAGIANFRALRGFNARHSVGTISVAASSNAVTGVNTKFKILGTGTWDIYKQQDMTYVGTVSAVASDTALTLTAGAAVAITSSEVWVAVRRGAATLYDANIVPDNLASKVGFLNATWGGVQWFANRPTSSAAATVVDESSRLWFSSPLDPEIVDLTKDSGTFINMVSAGSGPGGLMAIAPSANGLVVLKEREMFTIVGTDRTNYIPRKIAQVGTIATNSVQQYAGGVIFAAREGIFLFDGTRIENIGAALGQEYVDALRNFSASTSRCWSMIARDHYILNIQSYAPNVKPVINGSNYTRTEMVFVINLRTGAISTFTNLDFRGAVQLPPSTSIGSGTLFLVNTSAPLVKLCDAQYLFNTTGQDTIICETPNQVGPWFYAETRKFDLGDGERKKLFKQIAMTYLLSGVVIGMDTIPGLTGTGTRTSTDWQTVADWTNKRIKFLKRSNYLAFRFYEVSPGTATDFQMGPYAIGYKLQRPGRV